MVSTFKTRIISDFSFAWLRYQHKTLKVVKYKIHIWGDLCSIDRKVQMYCFSIGKCLPQYWQWSSHRSTCRNVIVGITSCLLSTWRPYEQKCIQLPTWLLALDGRNVLCLLVLERNAYNYFMSAYQSSLPHLGRRSPCRIPLWEEMLARASEQYLFNLKFRLYCCMQRTF